MQVNPTPAVGVPSQLPPRQQVELQQVLPDGQRAATVSESSRAVRPTAQSPEGRAPDDPLKKEQSPEQDVRDAIKQLNEAVKMYNSDLQFSMDEDTKLRIVKVMDRDTKDVIRQIPSEDIVRIAKAIDDFKSLLIKDKA